jgi:hypothetical protein
MLSISLRQTAKLTLAKTAALNFIGNSWPARRERAIFEELERRLDKIGKDVAKKFPNQIPNVLHFSYLYPAGKRLPFYASVAIRSAVASTGAARTFLYCFHEPAGPHWKAVKDLVTIVRVRDFKYFRNARIVHGAHKADVIRLLALYHIGGIYLDNDTITLRSMDDLRGNRFVMGVQGTRSKISTLGLCNAIMLGRRHSSFCKRWLRSYAYFRSRGYDRFWDFHSVKLPLLLSRDMPREITVLTSRAFFYPIWTGIERIVFAEDTAKNARFFKSAYAVHLWSALNPTLKSANAAYLRKSRSLYATWCRALLRGKP